MTKFEGCYLTNAGRSMVYDNGLPNITFTKAVTGSGIYISKDDIADMTELKEQRQEFGQINSVPMNHSKAVFGMTYAGPTQSEMNGWAKNIVQQTRVPQSHDLNENNSQ